MITKAQLSNLLTVFEALPNNPMRDADPERVAAIVDSYYHALSDLDYNMVQAAASAYLASGQFYPTPGNLRAKAVDIALLTMGVPTSAEAWGMVNGGTGIIRSVRCEVGRSLAGAVEGKGGNEYWAALAAYSQHTDECPACYDTRADNWHTAVKQAFDAMGGDRAVFTDNPAADRARFQEGYRQFVEREVLRFSMPADVRGYIAENKAKSLLAQQEMKMIAERMDR